MFNDIKFNDFPFVNGADEMEPFYITSAPPDGTLLDKTFYFKAAKRFLNIGLKLGGALTLKTLVVSTKDFS